MRICVLGAGVVGVVTAYYLARDGHRVRLIDSAGGVGLETSFGNGGQLSYNYVAPLADPGVLSKLPRWLLNPDAPVRFVPRLEPRQWRWALSFLKACTPAASLATSGGLLSLGLYSRALVHDLMRDEALSCNYVRNGKLVVYRSVEEFASGKRQMAFQARLGSEQRALDAAGCAALEPALAPLAPRLAGGIHTPGEEAADCYQFTVELAQVAMRKFGVELLTGCSVRRLIRDGSRLAAVQTSLGDIEADAFVVALGMGSVPLLAGLGISLPLYPLLGYSLTVPVGPNHKPPQVSITDSDHKIVYALLGNRLRVAGMADISGLHAVAKPARAALLLRQARETFPEAGAYDHAAIWFGRRPATPTSKPLIGATRLCNLWLNTGHGALGFTLACGSGKIVTDLIAGRPPAIAGPH